MLQESAVGLDIEWRPTFVAGRAPNPVALLQLSTRSRVVLIPVHHLRKPLPPSLAMLLSSPTVWKLGCGVGEDATKLLRDCGLSCSPTLEVGDVALRLQHEERVAFPHLPEDERLRPGLRGLALACGYDLEKPKRLSRSNWEKRPLTPEQQRYAALDAYAGLWIARCLHTLHQAAGGGGGLVGDAGHDSFGAWLAQQQAALPAWYIRHKQIRDAERAANRAALRAAA